MAHVLSLTDGTTTVPLSATNVMLSNYTPQAPEMAEGGTDGEYLGDVFYRNITEPVELYIYAAGKTALQTATRAIETMLERAARRRARKDGPRVYLQLQVDGEAAAWRSEILAGRLELAQNALALYANVAFEARLFITRRPYWEAAADTELSISSNGFAAATGGRTITNTSDSNWVQIAAAQITGAVPCALRVDVENLNAQVHILSGFVMVNNAYAAPATLDIYRMAAEAVGGSGVLSVAQPSGNAVNLRWLLPDAIPDACMGGYVRAVLVCNSIDFDSQVRGVIEHGEGASYSPLIWGPLVEVQSDVIDLGVFPMPPGGQTAGYSAVHFGIAGRHTSTWDANIHHLELIPVSSEKRIANGGTFGARSLPQNAAVVSDDILGETYVETSAGDRHAFLVGRGGPLWGFPGVVQRIVIAWSGLDGNWYNHQSSVRVWARPRRLTI